MGPATAEQVQAAAELHERMLPGFSGVIGDEFDRYFEITERVLWPEVWNHPGLDLKTRSLCNVAGLTALGLPNVANHIRGALANGATKDEIAEVILQMAFYAGWPRSVNAMGVAQRLFAGGGEA